MSFSLVSVNKLIIIQSVDSSGHNADECHLYPKSATWCVPQRGETISMQSTWYIKHLHRSRSLDKRSLTLSSHVFDSGTPSRIPREREREKERGRERGRGREGEREREREKNSPPEEKRHSRRVENDVDFVPICRKNCSEFSLSFGRSPI